MREQEVGVFDFVLLDEITMEKFMQNLKKRWVECVEWILLPLSNQNLDCFSRLSSPHFREWHCGDRERKSVLLYISHHRSTPLPRRNTLIYQRCTWLNQSQWTSIELWFNRCPISGFCRRHRRVNFLAFPLDGVSAVVGVSNEKCKLSWLCMSYAGNVG